MAVHSVYGGWNLDQSVCLHSHVRKQAVSQCRPRALHLRRRTRHSSVTDVGALLKALEDGCQLVRDQRRWNIHQGSSKLQKGSLVKGLGEDVGNLVNGFDPDWGRHKILKLTA